MPQDFDLFGDPIPENHGRRGRPEHIPTSENKNKVSMLVAFGWGDERIARALNITPPTLRKHYFSELKYRAEARDRLDARLAMKLWAEVEAGNVTAMKEFFKLLERNDLMIYGQRARPTYRDDKPKKEKQLGKKEQAAADAAAPDTGSTLGQLIAQRQGNLN